ncbi:MAG: hypothetical protein ACREQ3_19505, partial [Candidatus Binatia bacterium]
MKNVNGNGIPPSTDEPSLYQGGEVWDAPGGPLMLHHDLPHVWKHLHALYGLKATIPPDADREAKDQARREAITRWLNSFASRDELERALEAADLAWGEVRPSETALEVSNDHRPAFVNGLTTEAAHDHNLD